MKEKSLKKLRTITLIGLIVSSIVIVAGSVLKINSHGSQGNLLLMAGMLISAISLLALILSMRVVSKPEHKA